MNALSRRVALLAAVTCATLAASAVRPRPGFGQTQAGADVLGSAPFDRVTLADGVVLNVDPVSPRPLPVLDPAKVRAERRKAALADEPPREGNIGLPGEPSKVRAPEDDAATPGAGDVTIHLLEGEARDFKVKRANIRSVEYYEDMLIAEAERLTLARDFTRAFECLLKVKARAADWKGLGDAVDRLLFAEGSVALLDGDGERGLRLLRELSARRRDYPGLADKLAASYATRATRAFELGLFALGRSLLHEVEPLAPGHIAPRAVRARFEARARELFDSAAKLDGPARLDALTEALRVWPALAGAEAAYREAFLAGPALDVAVLDVPRKVGPWVRSPADARVTRLLYRPLLAHDGEEALKAQNAPDQLSAGVAASDLGRDLLVAIQGGISWSDRSRPVAPVDVVRSLTGRADPASPSYSARWADLLDRVAAPDPAHVEVRLGRAGLNAASWLLGPIGPAHAGTDGRVAAADGSRSLVGSGPFRLAAAEGDRLELRAEPPAAVRRLREVRYPNAQAMLAAFERGEVTLLERVPPDRVAALTSTDGVKLGRYTHPSLHQIALDGRNPAFRNRSLRRGLSYAIDRPALLEESILRRPPDAANATADGPFPRGSFADAPDVKPLGYDPLLARMLVGAARKELGGAALSFRFQYPAVPEAQAVAPRLVEMFKLAGLEIVPVERPESELEADLRSGARFDLAYRVARCDEPVAQAGPLLCPAYDAPPATDPLAAVASPRILQLLLQLERASEFPTAKGLLLQIDRECRDELPTLPLWQVEDRYAWRDRLKGPADEAERLYQGISGWTVAPWFYKDPW